VLLCSNNTALPKLRHLKNDNTKKIIGVLVLVHDSTYRTVRSVHRDRYYYWRVDTTIPLVRGCLLCVWDFEKHHSLHGLAVIELRISKVESNRIESNRVESSRVLTRINTDRCIFSISAHVGVRRTRILYSLVHYTTVQYSKLQIHYNTHITHECTQTV
jgi:hypothetical protein